MRGTIVPESQVQHFPGRGARPRADRRPVERKTKNKICLQNESSLCSYYSPSKTLQQLLVQASKWSSLLVKAKGGVPGEPRPLTLRPPVKNQEVGDRGIPPHPKRTVWFLKRIVRFLKNLNESLFIIHTKTPITKPF